ncbi:hypothetical protein K435DRAFT_960607 [Dendrothele bispora CBS 962.96]|uniref:F-box domain-containing protein n=1 Tax=Dendrothele bispora (strain CBS 962.96) TaxID=1314807 RepID=A0A4S8MT65_DENBC|nr:hypothetical protein K435DRAFT_960607 [Dendrothele bispora CBS 962.96]
MSSFDFARTRCAPIINENRTPSPNLSPRPYPSPIHSHLPPEIMTIIFTICCTSLSKSWEDRSDVYPKLPPPFVLMSVCLSWRTLVLNTQHIWTSLQIRISDRESKPSNAHQKVSALMEWWRSKSHLLPINIAMKIPPAHQHVFGNEDLFERLIPLADKWESLHLQMPSSYFSPWFLAERIHAPKLRSIVFEISRSSRLIDTYPLADKHQGIFSRPKTMILEAPLLSELTIISTRTKRRRDPLFDFLHWSFPCSTLTKLHLVGRLSIHLIVYLNILSEAKNLIDCHLDLPNWTPNMIQEIDPSLKNIILPKLQNLLLYSLVSTSSARPYSGLEILRFLTLRSLQSLTIQNNVPNHLRAGVFPLGSVLTELYTRSFFPLKILNIRCSKGFEFFGIQEFLRNVPTIQDVTLEECGFETEKDSLNINLCPPILP